MFRLEATDIASSVSPLGVDELGRANHHPVREHHRSCQHYSVESREARPIRVVPELFEASGISSSRIGVLVLIEVLDVHVCLWHRGKSTV